MRAAKERLQEITNAIDDGVTLAGLNGKVLDCNEAALKQLGLTRDEFIGKNVYDVVAPEDRQRAMEGALKVLETGRILTQVSVLRKNGSCFPAEISVTILCDKKKKPTGFIGVTRDISERKKAEKELMESEQQFRSLAEESPNMIFINQQGRVVYANKKSEEITGYSKTEFYSPTFNFLNLTSPEYTENIKQFFTKHLIGEEIPPYEYVLITKEGKRINTIITTKLIDYRGKKAIMGIITDISERKIAEEKIMKSQEELNAFFSSNDVLMSIIELKNGDFIYALPNQKVAEFFNRPLNEVIGKSGQELGFSQQTISQLVSILRECEISRKSITIEYPISYLGSIREYRGTISLLPLGASGRQRFSLVSIEITEQKRLQAELHNYAKNLEELVDERTKTLQEKERMAAIGETAGMVGHDLRNPLQSIIGEVYLAKSELDSLPDGENKKCLKESVQAIEEQISYMDKIVSDLQTFVKPVEAKIEIINLKSVITVLLAQTDFPKNIEARMQVDDRLIVSADAQLLKRVLINLVTNAVQAMPEGGELTIKAQTNDKKRIQITVEDTGTGIPEEIKPKIFTPLFTTKSKGQGFGLAVCKRVIEAQNGTITFESQVGQGTKFIIELPITQ